MKNVIYLLVFLMGVSVFGQAEEMTLIKSDVIDRKLSEHNYGVVGSSDNAIYVLKKRAKGAGFGVSGSGRYLLMLEKYDKELNFVDEIEVQDVFIPFSNLAQKKIFEFSLQTQKGDMFICYSENKEGHTVLYQLKLDKEKFQFEEPVLLSKVKLHNREMDCRFTFNLVESEDKSHFAIYSIAPYNEPRIVGNRKKGKETYLFVEVFDSELNSKWSREELVTSCKFETSKKYFDMLNTQVVFNELGGGLARYDYISSSLSNTGSFNMLDKLANGSFLLYSFNSINSEAVIKDLKFDNEHNVGKAKMQYDDENNLRITFFYSNENIEGAGGVGLETFDPINLNSIQRYTTDFDSNNIKDFMGWDTEEFNKDKDGLYSELSGYNILEIYKHSDNGMTIVLNRTRFRGQKPRPKFVMQFSESNLVFINVSEIGEINWISRYVKKQDLYVNPTFLTLVKCTSDNIYFLYRYYKEQTLQINKLNLKDHSIESEMLEGKIRLNQYSFMSTVHEFDEQVYLLLARRESNTMILKFMFE